MSQILPLLLSYSRAARMLGIGRGASLHQLIKAGQLVPVMLLGRAFIPREQVEALARAGAPSLPPAPRTTKAKARSGGSIADVEI